MEGDAAQHPRKPVRGSRFINDIRCFARARKQSRGRSHKTRRCCPRMRFHRRKRRKRRRRTLDNASINERLQIGGSGGIPQENFRETDGNGMGARPTFARSLQSVTPPLQANLGGKGIVRRLACPGKLMIETIKCEEQRSLFGRREETREKTILIGATNGCFADRERLLWRHRRRRPEQRQRGSG
jgi:hypothetical protein